MECNSSTKKIFSFVTKAGERRKTRKSSTPSQIIPLDEQTKNDFELRHDTKLKDTTGQTHVKIFCFKSLNYYLKNAQNGKIPLGWNYAFKRKSGRNRRF